MPRQICAMQVFPSIYSGNFCKYKTYELPFRNALVAMKKPQLVYSPLSRPDISRGKAVRLSMVVVSALLCVLALDPSGVFPVFNKNESVENSIQDYSLLLLKQLVNSPANKAVFSQLLYSDNAFYDTEHNVVGTLDFVRSHQYQRQPYAANGYIGSRVPVLGHGFAYDNLPDESSDSADNLSNGWPLFNKRYAGAFAAGFYNNQESTPGTNFEWLLQYGSESVISAIPQWTTLSVTAQKNGKTYRLDPQAKDGEWGDITQYVQNMSLADGVVSTLYVWLGTVRIQYDVVAHRENPSLGVVRAQFTNVGTENFSFNVSDVLDAATSQRCRINSASVDPERGIYMLYQPEGVDEAYAATYSSLRFQKNQCDNEVYSSFSDKVSHTLAFTLKPGKSLSVTKYVGIVTSDLNPEKYKLFQTVLSDARAASVAPQDYSSVIGLHRESWNNIMSDALTAVFPDDLLLTLTTRASVFHLCANTRSDATGLTAALPVAGLSSDSYAGMVFWDTDLWMVSGLLPWNPEHAKSLVLYRLHTHQQALENVNGPLAPKLFLGAAYPWTSGRYGNCTATGPCFDYEYHLNVAVAKAAWEVYLSGGGDEEFLETVVYPLVSDAALFLASYVEYNSTLDKYTTRNLTDPDEYANHVDNGAFTNAAISKIMRWAQTVYMHLGKTAPADFAEIAGKMYMPTDEDSDIVLEYSGMSASVGIKQADVVMITYPLDNELTNHKQALSNMDFYSRKQVSFGPAMTFPIFSIVSSVLLETGCLSQSYLLKAVQPFLRGPFAQFSEQNNDDYQSNGGTYPAFPFMTAHGGFLQAIVQGLLGLRFDVRNESGKIKRVLRLDPLKLRTLPNGATFHGIHYMNHTLVMELTSSGLIVRDVTTGAQKDKLAAGNESIEIVLGNRLGGLTYFVLPGQNVVLPVYETAESFPGSFSECYSAAFTNITDGADGDAAALVNDGDNTTHWQSVGSTGKILVDLKKSRTLTSGLINWGDKPPRHLRVLASNVNDWDTIDYLSHVDFGNNLYEKYAFANPGPVTPQKDVFTEVYSADVPVNAPIEDPGIENPIHHNTSSIEFKNVRGRFFLLEFEGVHDGENGAKVFEVSLY